MATNKKPTHTLRCGNIKATIWQNVGGNGPFFATTFSRPFKDQSGAWRNGTSFGLNDLEALLIVASEANCHSCTEALTPALMGSLRVLRKLPNLRLVAGG
jgi:hypothetical protein